MINGIVINDSGFVGMRCTMLFMLLLFIDLGNGEVTSLHGFFAGSLKYQSTIEAILSSRPYFENGPSRNVTVLAGQPALLQCRVRNLGDKVVSWVRARDLAVLASSTESHTSDMRVASLHDADTDEWTLRINPAAIKDSGIYLCQINIEPKLQWPVSLRVEAAVAKISGPTEVYVRSGSTISLLCTLKGPTGSPALPHWFQEGRPVALDSPRGGVSLETERTESGMTSKLMLTRAVVADGGNYTCAPPGAESASVVVHVLNGEQHAAMQRNRNSCLANRSSILWVSITLVMYSWTHWNVPR
ncbi:zwei Ig domain protein zig-8-like isoform X2 [Artemia franciscana]|uniref:zwei Ig domain protein zig-8-like isoform X2 n=1 Tax=Artemia franciscana TaxID=6661 RepID=UPI0032DBCA42